MTEVGFIGLGSMGHAMARNLIKAGHDVRGFDVRAEAMSQLEKDGGRAAATPAQAADGADLLVVVVFTAAQAEQVLFGKDGALQTLAKGATVLMDTTMSPAQAQAIEAKLSASGHLFVDAPVTGGSVGADEGTLTFIASGSAAAMRAARPLMQVMGAKIAECGDRAGPGSTVKMINQMMCGIMVAASAEAIALAAKAGADPNVVFDVIASGAARSYVWENRVPAMLAHDFTPRGVVDIFTKDLAIALEGAKDVSFPAPLTAAAMQQFLAATAMGHGLDDDGAVVKVYEATGAVDVAAAARRS
ncbi:MAG: putative dehydrogenase [Gammaproteobacteria bacterium]|jgi:putative dehydrogenase